MSGLSSSRLESLIPLYSYDGAFVDHVTVRRATRMEAVGHVKIVRHRKGLINRAILLRTEDDPRPIAPRDFQGMAYSFRQRLTDGRRAWKLRPLQGGRSDTNLAPRELRSVFMGVVRDCMRIA